MALPTGFRRRILPLYQRIASRVHELEYLFIELTNRCNLLCLHCGSDCTRAPDSADLPSADVLRVMEEIARAHDPAKITVVLSGGEPLLYRDVFGLGRHIHDMGFRWGMVTNGFGWNADHIRQARDAKMRYVTVSLDGLEDTQEGRRCRLLSFKLLSTEPFRGSRAL